MFNLLLSGSSNKMAAEAAIAGANAARSKAQGMELSAKAAKRQAKAESIVRNEVYNDTAAMQMVMGVASGRNVSEGSVKAITDKDFENYQWDQLWNTHNTTINQAAIYGDVSQMQLGALNQLKTESKMQNIRYAQAFFKDLGTGAAAFGG